MLITGDYGRISIPHVTARCTRLDQYLYNYPFTKAYYDLPHTFRWEIEFANHPLAVAAAHAIKGGGVVLDVTLDQPYREVRWETLNWTHEPYLVVEWSVLKPYKKEVKCFPSTLPI
jgi:hypothetical protein